jgi:hypothetical protein
LTVKKVVQISKINGDGEFGNDWTSVRGEKTRAVHGKSKFTEPEEKASQVKSKVKSMLIIFLDIKRTVHK